ncbi:hypothetical protein B9G39_29620 [Zooshikella ganghwensis]|uniref:Transposase IS801/IS1294 domain-containing protein n=1 Tax=Zooshikella ganghwensis TaxID=202772 RepID=A0A4P9VFV1_9GAMM|nr:hypothetical protein B9G39_29620 [Zooshikella ganghwensis]
MAHYDGHCVIFYYLDHNTKTHRRFECTAEDFMTRLTQHIPEKGFRLIRYYGFLANRVRGKLLQKCIACWINQRKMLNRYIGLNCLKPPLA